MQTVRSLPYPLPPPYKGWKRSARIRRVHRKSFARARARALPMHLTRVSFARKLQSLFYFFRRLFWLSVKVKCYLICGRERKSHPSAISEPPLPQYIYLDGSMRARAYERPWLYSTQECLVMQWIKKRKNCKERSRVAWNDARHSGWNHGRMI